MLAVWTDAAEPAPAAAVLPLTARLPSQQFVVKGLVAVPAARTLVLLTR